MEFLIFLRQFREISFNMLNGLKGLTKSVHYVYGQFYHIVVYLQPLAIPI